MPKVIPKERKGPKVEKSSNMQFHKKHKTKKKKHENQTKKKNNTIIRKTNTTTVAKRSSNKTLHKKVISDQISDTKECNMIDKLHVPEVGFSWYNEANTTVPPNAETSSDDEEEPKEDLKRKKKKLNAAERREQEKQKEREIRQREEALASNETPNSVDQFDRWILSSPDSSVAWIRYMAYHLQATEIDKARAVAKRAIKTINYREEDERLNVWKSWLNLESTFGTPETLDDVFQNALRTNDMLKVYKHMLTVHANAGRYTELEKLIAIMTRKFKLDPQVWVDCGTALLKINQKQKLRHIMQRALQSLPKFEHVNLLVKFANLEKDLGDKERVQQLFELILSSYPKRVDVWTNYIDFLIKSGEIDAARKVLKQACAQTLRPKKMKILYMKLKNFETKYGTPEDIACAHQMAVDYVEKQCNRQK